METIVGYMAANPSVGTFLRNPTMEGKNVKDVLDKLGNEASFHPFTKNFLNLLVDKKRIGAIEAIAEEFENLYCESTDTQVSIDESPLPPPFSNPFTVKYCVEKKKKAFCHLSRTGRVDGVGLGG